MSTRSRHGCATCRKRKKKCDEGKPECGQCISRGVKCGGYGLKLTWSNSVASRGRLAGSSFTVPDQAQIETTPLFSPTNSATIDLQRQAHEADRNCIVAAHLTGSPQSGFANAPCSPSWDRRPASQRSEEQPEVMLKRCRFPHHQEGLLNITF